MSEPSSRAMEHALESRRHCIAYFGPHDTRVIALALDAARAEERERCARMVKELWWYDRARLAAAIRTENIGDAAVLEIAAMSEERTTCQ